LHHRVSRIEIGRELIAAKDECPHGGWSAWLEQEFKWTQQTAMNYMNVAEAFGTSESLQIANSKPVLNLAIGTKALYALASPRVPH
jgi:hypothetical protein